MPYVLAPILTFTMTPKRVMLVAYSVHIITKTMLNIGFVSMSLYLGKCIHEFNVLNEAEELMEELWYIKSLR